MRSRGPFFRFSQENETERIQVSQEKSIYVLKRKCQRCQAALRSMLMCATRSDLPASNKKRSGLRRLAAVANASLQ